MNENEYKRQTQDDWTFPDLTVEELGELKPCQNCGALTYAQFNLPENSGYRLLPKGFTNQNRRMIIFYKGKFVLLCTKCRYESDYRRF